MNGQPAIKYGFQPSELNQSQGAPRPGTDPRLGVGPQSGSSLPESGWGDMPQEPAPRPVQYQGVRNGQMTPPAGGNPGNNPPPSGNVATSYMSQRPLSYPIVAPAVVPSAQGRVYGSTDETPFNGGMPRINQPPTGFAPPSQQQ
jgi:hypothetical protein